MKKILLLFSLLLLLASIAPAQMVANYSDTSWINTSNANQTITISVNVQGNTSCNGPNGCPPGVVHTPSYQINVGSAGGGSNGTPVCPSCFLNFGGQQVFTFAQIGNGTNLLSKTTRVACSQLGSNFFIGPSVPIAGLNLPTVLEIAITWTKTQFFAPPYPQVNYCSVASMVKFPPSNTAPDYPGPIGGIPVGPPPYEVDNYYESVTVCGRNPNTKGTVWKCGGPLELFGVTGFETNPYAPGYPDCTNYDAGKHPTYRPNL